MATWLTFISSRSYTLGFIMDQQWCRLYFVSSSSNMQSYNSVGNLSSDTLRLVRISNVRLWQTTPIWHLCLTKKVCHLWLIDKDFLATYQLLFSKTPGIFRKPGLFLGSKWWCSYLGGEAPPPEATTLSLWYNPHVCPIIMSHGRLPYSKGT